MKREVGKRLAVFLVSLVAVALAALAAVLWLTRNGERGHDQVQWAEYIPIVWSVEEDGLVRRPEMLTAGHIGALAKVLAGYGERFRYHPGPPERFYVSAELAANEELIWNFTTKAQDLVRSGALDDIGGRP